MNLSFAKGTRLIVSILCLGMLAQTSIAQESDWRRKEIDISFRSRRIDGFRFEESIG